MNSKWTGRTHSEPHQDAKVAAHQNASWHSTINWLPGFIWLYGADSVRAELALSVDLFYQIFLGEIAIDGVEDIVVSRLTPIPSAAGFPGFPEYEDAAGYTRAS